MVMQLKVRHTTHYRYKVPASYAVQRLILTPLDFASQKVRSWTIEAPGIDHALAGAALADEAVHFARLYSKRHRTQQTRRRTAQANAQLLDREQGVGHLRTGSNRSFNPSPNWLKARTVRKSTINGKTNTHQA